MRRWLAAIACAGLLALSLPAAADSPVPVDARRGVEQTLLTFPEWFLVHSPAEYALMTATRPAHDFPFMRHIGQLWSSYADVTREQWRRRYPANPGYHLMIMVIAGSTTIEYALRAGYENTIGRISWESAASASAEDRYGARVAQDYVDFIRREPWYLYDFGRALRGLWTGVPLSGPDMLRKWERRYALTTEYLLKAGYAKLIEAATRAAYDPAAMTTMAVADRSPGSLPPDAGVRIVSTLADGKVLLQMPRYQAFTPAAMLLAQRGVNLVDIAGNDSVILVSVLAQPRQRAEMQGATLLFEQPLLTQPGRSRLGLLVPVRELGVFLRETRGTGAEVEHIYDY